MRIANFVQLPGDEWGNCTLGKHYVIKAAAEEAEGGLGTLGALKLEVIEPKEVLKKWPRLTGWFKEVDLQPGCISQQEWAEIVRPELEAIWKERGNPYGKWPFEEGV